MREIFQYQDLALHSYDHTQVDCYYRTII